jgi:putative inorganic carbon (hco3(-)) transporter
MGRSGFRRPTPWVLSAGALVVCLSGALLSYHYRHSVDKSFAVAVFTLVGIVAVVALPHVRPVYPVAVGLGLSVFSGYWGQFGVPFGLDRPLLMYGIVATLVQALPDVRRRSVPRLTVIGWVLIVLSMYAIVSADLSGTLANHAPLFALLDQLSLIGFALFILAPTIFATEYERNVLLVTLVVIGAYLGWIALFEGLHINALVVPSYINNPSLGIHAGRARGPFLEAVANGMMLYTCGVASAMATAKWWDRKAVRFVCGLVVLLSGLGIIFTVTREVWIGSAAATLVTLCVYRRLRPFVLPALIGGLVLVVAALAFVPGLHSTATGRANDARPVWDRLNSDAAGLRMLDAQPALGFGWYRFGAVSFAYYRQASSYPLTVVGRIHNVFLGVAVDLGIVGFAAWLFALLGALAQGFTSRGPPDCDLWKMGLLAVAVNWIIVANFTPLTYALPNHIVWLWPGIAIAAGSPRMALSALRPAVVPA